ncbi:hypothetical protein AVEN_147800-1 [Araneus ventricosus]|uniref:Uncharacterized protein n=1 Tax=Araneus ventricosus TaxID=182803 RepID=A0A4Y1ZRU0_ARAVE|nr:hypothetical protein AVEN_147800-1 [Araneus ventricosus]
MVLRAAEGDLMLEHKVKLFKEKLNGLHDIFRRVSEKKSTNAQDKDEFSNYKADILMLYVKAVSSLVTGKELDLFIELKNELMLSKRTFTVKLIAFLS